MKPAVGGVKIKKDKNGMYQFLNFEIFLPKVLKRKRII